VLAQLGNRVQHALRAFTRVIKKAVAAAAETFRPNPKLDTRRSSPSWAKARRWCLFLKERTPAMVDVFMIRPPTARIRNDHARGTQGDHEQEPGKGKIRHHDRFRVRL